MSNTNPDAPEPLSYLEWSADPDADLPPRGVDSDRYYLDEWSSLNAGDEPPRWQGMPDPHRHNPFGVAVVLALFAMAWAAIGGIVVLMIAGVIR